MEERCNASVGSRYYMLCWKTCNTQHRLMGHENTMSLPFKNRPLQNDHRKLSLSACGIPGNIATMLGLCTIIMLVELRAKEGDTSEIGDVASRLLGQNTRFSSAQVCTIGRRMQCFGTSTSSSMRGQKRAKRGLSAMREAQMMPMLTSMADHVTAWMPDSGSPLVLFCKFGAVCTDTHQQGCLSSPGGRPLRA
jgi:hypothetical protein